MWAAKALRAWIGSVVVSTILLVALWVLEMHQISSRNISAMPIERLEQAAAGIIVLSGAAFALIAGFVYIPVFILLDRVLAASLTRFRAVLLGSILGLAPRMLIAWRVEESRSATAWLLYWARNLPRFPFTVLPFAIPGAVFGWLWCIKNKNPTAVAAPPWA